MNSGRLPSWHHDTSNCLAKPQVRDVAAKTNCSCPSCGHRSTFVRTSFSRPDKRSSRHLDVEFQSVDQHWRKHQQEAWTALMLTERSLRTAVSWVVCPAPAPSRTPPRVPGLERTLSVCTYILDALASETVLSFYMTFSTVYIST